HDGRRVAQQPPFLSGFDPAGILLVGNRPDLLLYEADGMVGACLGRERRPCLRARAEKQAGNDRSTAPRDGKLADPPPYTQSDSSRCGPSMARPARVARICRLWSSMMSRSVLGTSQASWDSSSNR